MLVNGRSNYDSLKVAVRLVIYLRKHEWIYEIPSEIQAKGTGLGRSAGKEDPVELDSSLALFGDMPRCSISGRRGSRGVRREAGVVPRRP